MIFEKKHWLTKKKGALHLVVIATLLSLLVFWLLVLPPYLKSKALAQQSMVKAGPDEPKEQTKKIDPSPYIVILDNDISGNNICGLYIKRSRVLVEKCRVYQNGNAGLVVGDDAQALIQDSQIFRQQGAGIMVMGEGSSRVAVSGSRIYLNKMAGVQLGGKERIKVVARESFRKNPSAILAQEKARKARPKEGNVISAKIRNSRIFRNGESGIKCQSEYPNQSIHLNAAKNKIFQNRKGGVFLANAAKVILHDNAICDNRKAGVSANHTLANSFPQVDIYRNIIRGNEEAGLEIIAARCGSVGVCNNLILNNGGSGIRFKITPMRIANNTIVSNGRLTEGSGIDQEGKNTPFIVNNILAYNMKTGLNVAKIKGCSYNLLFANGGSGTCCDDCTSSSKLIESKQLGGHSRRRGDLICDPLFKNPDRFDYRLREWSPAIDAGLPSPEFFDSPGGLPSQGGKRNDLGMTGGPLAVCWDPNDLSLDISE